MRQCNWHRLPSGRHQCAVLDETRAASGIRARNTGFGAIIPPAAVLKKNFLSGDSYYINVRLIMKSKLEIVTVAAVFLVVGGILFYHPSLPVFMGEFNSVDGSLYAAAFIYLATSLAVFCTTACHLIPRVGYKKRTYSFILQSFALIAVLSIVKQWLDHEVLLMWNLPTTPDVISDKMLTYFHRKTVTLPTIPVHLGMYLAGCVYGLVRTIRSKARDQQRIIEENMQADIKMLRSQINPHVFFNALNNIYAIAVRNKDEEAGRAILTLSTMMRFMLYESNAEEVALEKEIEQITNLIDIARLKYPGGAAPDIRFREDGIDGNTRIAPLLLIPFVENALKHGLSATGEGYINIAVHGEPQGLTFLAENSKNDSRDSFRTHSGIGLENVQRRLALLYPERHTLIIEDSEEAFRVELTLKYAE